MADIFAHFTNNGVPLETSSPQSPIVDAPVITIRRADTGAEVQGSPAQMTEVGGGSWVFTFAEDPTLTYAIVADGDPNGTLQVTVEERYSFGALNGQGIDDVLAIIDASPNPWAALQAVLQAQNAQILSIINASPNPWAVIETSILAGQATILAAIAALDESPNPVLVAIAALNDISVGDILSASLGIVSPSDTVAQALTRLEQIDLGSPNPILADTAAILQAVGAMSPNEILQAINALNDISVADILTASLGVQSPSDTVAQALNRLRYNLDESPNPTLAAINALNDISVADILAGALTSGDSVDDALSRLIEIDLGSPNPLITGQALILAAINNLDESPNPVLAAIAALNDISVADILAAEVESPGDTVAQALARMNEIDQNVLAILAATTASPNPVLVSLDSLTSFLQGGREIDFTGQSPEGWQRIEYDDASPRNEVARYNLYDESGSRITGTVAAFLAAGSMIAREELV